MAGKGLEFLMGRGFTVSKDELRRQNRLALGYFAVVGLPVSLANVLVQTVIQQISFATPSIWLLPAYFIVLFFFERFVLPAQCDNATLLVYLLEAPVLLLSILLGTVWDPSHSALTFLMFMAVIPIFILDAPWRVAVVGAGWNVLFAVLVVLFKDPELHAADLAHALEFYLLSLAVTEIVLRLRLEVVYNLDRARYHLEHDMATNTQNRLSMESHAEDFVGRPLFCCMGTIDHLALIGDYYGKHVADDVLHTFSEVMKETFCERNTFRYSGDEFLCLVPDIDDAEGYALVERVRDAIADARFEGMHAPVSLSFGSTWGTPANTGELHGMVQLTNIYNHKAERQGEGTTVGGTFSEEALRAGIASANIGMHAESFEVNQLTGLPTMPHFVLHARETLCSSVVDMSRKPQVGYVGLVRFRDFNEKYGYERGDDLIRTLAHLMVEAMPNRHVTYVSGSRFASLCYLDEVEAAVEHVRAGIAAYLPEEGLKIKAGFAQFHPGDDVITLVDRAHMAERTVEPEQVVRHRFYDESLDEQVRFERYLVSHLDEAIENGWLKVFYQPIMWCQSAGIASLEALSRWDDPTHGMLAPYRFISVLEREHLIYKLSLHVVRQSLADIRALKEWGLPQIPVSVNLSRYDFAACDMVEEISRLVEEAGLDPSVLAIEITESAFTESQEFLAHEVERFHERGFAVWMDDFGSEYSTLNLLEDLDFDLVKLDMRLMRNFSEEGRNAIIVSAILEMCARLGMETLVEGVEEAEQRDLLREMGAGKLQGYLYSPPKPFDEICDIIEKRGWA